MPHTLPALPYAVTALEPHIDAKTMEIHHGKHHQAYITNLNNALAGNTALESKTIEELIADLDAVPDAIRTAVRNNGGGHANHSLFWITIGPGKGGTPTGPLAAAIDTGLSTGLAIVPVITGSSISAVRLSEALFQRGISAQPILFPAVPEKAARLRFFMSCEHTEAQIKFTVDTVAQNLAAH